MRGRSGMRGAKVSPSRRLGPQIMRILPESSAEIYSDMLQVTTTKFGFIYKNDVDLM